MEIQITNYLSDDEIKEIVSSELRLQIKDFFRDEKNGQRLLSNLAYEIVQQEVEKIVPNYQDNLVLKVSELIKSKDLSYYVFNHSYSDNKPNSFGSKLIEQTAKENAEMIKANVIKAIQEKDYSDEVFNKLETLGDNFASNIYNLVEVLRKK